MKKLKKSSIFFMLLFSVLFLSTEMQVYAQSAKLAEEDNPEAAIVTNVPISVGERVNTDFSMYRTYNAETPKMVSFFDYKENYNVAYADGTKVIVQRYDSNLELIDKLTIELPYRIFGNIICDDQGYYYIVSGQSDSNTENCVTMAFTKYDYNGKRIAECALKGYDTWDSYWGTMLPFRAGNCSVVVNNGVLVCNYARQMYSGHQSNYVIYVDCNTMTKLSGEAPYSSHSFDQRVISVSDGGYLTLSHGDSYERGFEIAKVESDRSNMRQICNFHFREGSDREYGYNETFAQLGGITETSNAYIFCASSEKTLSIDVAPTNVSYCGHSESRDLFIQILKKDFYKYTGADRYYVSGMTRTAEGTKPASAKTKLKLSGIEVDYGVIWLTDYEDSYYAANPKVIAVSETQFAVMWEKREYDNPENAKTYYAVLDEDGNVVREPLEIKDCKLAGNIDLVYKEGKIYWATSDEYGDYIHSLDVSDNAAPENGWYEEDGAKYWYENRVKQGTEGRGKEIYDPASDAWYWLDAPDGKMAFSKDVYQESLAGAWGDYIGADGERYGKWVRYDEDGHMVKGWQYTEDGTYFFDDTYGTMAKGYATIDGKEYYFNKDTGILERELGEVPEMGWKNIDGIAYWYEGYVRQGYSVDSSYRGKEIYDSGTDAWYWLDNVDDGKKAVSKDVYQESLAGEWGDYIGADGERYGKWVRYDENGHMIKGWSANEDGTYYFDLIYGTMAKGNAVIDGQNYYFDVNTGILQ